MSASSLSDMFEDEGGGSAWVVTFADMMTLILVFFILLYTLADFEDEAYKELIESVQVIDGDGSQISVIDFATRKGRNPEPLKAVEDMLGMNPGTVPVDTIKPALVSEMESMIDYSDIADSVELTYNGDQINLQIDGRYLFASGQARRCSRSVSRSTTVRTYPKTCSAPAKPARGSLHIWRRLDCAFTSNAPIRLKSRNSWSKVHKAAR